MSSNDPKETSESSALKDCLLPWASLGRAQDARRLLGAGRPCRGRTLRARVGHRLFRRRAGSGHARRQRGSPAPAGHAGGVVDVLEARPGRVRRVHRRAEGGRGAALHAPLAARAGRGSLPALRHADDRQGRHPAVVTSVRFTRMSEAISGSYLKHRPTTSQSSTAYASVRRHREAICSAVPHGSVTSGLLSWISLRSSGLLAAPNCTICASIPHERGRVISKPRASEPLAGTAGPSATRTLRTALRRPRLAAADLVTPGFVAQAGLENISGRLLYQRALRGPAEIRRRRTRKPRERGSERLRRASCPPSIVLAPPWTVRATRRSASTKKLCLLIHSLGLSIAATFRQQGLVPSPLDSPTD